MSITEQEIRDLVREALARHAGSAPDPGGLMDAAAQARRHASHTLLPLASGGDGDGMCIIEPAVRCTHCGYCLSYGH
jgi:hypothetical protein